jgi:hypothetical protein
MMRVRVAVVDRMIMDYCWQTPLACSLKVITADERGFLPAMQKEHKIDFMISDDLAQWVLMHSCDHLKLDICAHHFQESPAHIRNSVEHNIVR